MAGACSLLVVIYFLSELTNFKLFSSFGFLNSMGTINIIQIYPIFFVIGSLYFLYRDRVKWDMQILLVFLILWILFFRTLFFDLASLVCLPYIVLCIAHIPIPHISKSSKYGDFSYGLYIYAFPIQQTIIST